MKTPYNVLREPWRKHGVDVATNWWPQQRSSDAAFSIQVSVSVLQDVIDKEGQQAMNRDEGSYQLSHAYDRFLGTASSRCVKNRKN